MLLGFKHPAAFGRLCVETTGILATCRLGKAPAAFGRLCVETRSGFDRRLPAGPAAFGRLCVETTSSAVADLFGSPAAFGRLCVETLSMLALCRARGHQPPSGGCVLKPLTLVLPSIWASPAAFGRLCVETAARGIGQPAAEPAAFGRLCVETDLMPQSLFYLRSQPPSGGCVLKQHNQSAPQLKHAPSRLRAAVC